MARRLRFRQALTQGVLAAALLVGILPGRAFSSGVVRSERTVSEPVLVHPGFPFIAADWQLFSNAVSGSSLLDQPTAATEIPDRLFLDQNYPNPFNPTTMIRYGLPSETHVRLTVHTILGTQIKTLIDETQAAGTYVFDFAALDLPSGSYFYRLQTPMGTLTRRMTISK